MKTLIIILGLIVCGIIGATMLLFLYSSFKINKYDERDNYND